MALIPHGANQIIYINSTYPQHQHNQIVAAKNNMKLFLVLAVASLFTALVSANSDIVISIICSRHSDVNYCRTQLEMALFPDLPGLTAASFDLTEECAAQTDNINVLLGKETNDQVKNALTACLAQYSGAAYSISQSEASYGARDYWKMKNDVLRASSYAAACENGFVAANVASPLSCQNANLQKSAEIVAILADALDGKV